MSFWKGVLSEIKKAGTLAASALPAISDTFANAFSGNTSKIIPDIGKDFRDGWKASFGKRGDNAHFGVVDSQNAKREQKEAEIARKDAQANRAAMAEQTREQFQNPSLGEG